MRSPIRRTRWWRASPNWRDGLEHDPEKWKPVFRKDHAQTNDQPLNAFAWRAAAGGAHSTQAEAAKISANPTRSVVVGRSPTISTVESTPTTGMPSAPSDAVAADKRRTIANHMA